MLHRLYTPLKASSIHCSIISIVIVEATGEDLFKCFSQVPSIWGTGEGLILGCNCGLGLVLLLVIRGLVTGLVSGVGSLKYLSFSRGSFVGSAVLVCLFESVKLFISFSLDPAWIVAVAMFLCKLLVLSLATWDALARFYLIVSLGVQELWSSILNLRTTVDPAKFPWIVQPDNICSCNKFSRAICNWLGND